ncbi:TRAF-like family protein [Arabidopsis thaliana]|uniref:MATH domain and coiled-coil domain-containing protein At2g01790 n=1 Tax=Arabidopsis thaliana TaxID=3702 RepID=MCC03_ARATH|nr:TRAF-like family protein [Arabidopsis thaliana]Q9ZUA7.1 RecName: Full=MATH domain and coiled-coil domain-containing protein At2g01790; AltName: Full=RTM3-like protein At2g01790 [Arabidopsis thaliana]AAD12693.1 hypothetical protein [Arabidopsis thaliana]AEC05498.1 TRAF-like family protein [Arabidopsis thaliana]|eukprot:NP_178288.1 TRAF-like family protein [Arabidopsis thaliana]
MGNHQAVKKLWVINNFSFLDSDRVYSDIFVVGGCKWCLLALPEGNNNYIYDYFSLYLCVPDSEYLPSGWRRRAKVSFTMVNQVTGELSQQQEGVYWFDEKNTTQGFGSMFRLLVFQSSYKGFLVNGEVDIVAEVDVVEVIGKLDVSEESESIDSNGFDVLASQVESVNSLFGKYPCFASKLCPKTPRLKKNVVQSLNEILCKSTKELSNGDLAEAYSALRFVTKAGFKLDWLEKKLKETGKSRLQEIEEDLKDLKVKCADMDALLEFLR